MSSELLDINTFLPSHAAVLSGGGGPGASLPVANNPQWTPMLDFHGRSYNPMATLGHHHRHHHHHHHSFIKQEPSWAALELHEESYCGNFTVHFTGQVTGSNGCRYGQFGATSPVPPPPPPPLPPPPVAPAVAAAPQVVTQPRMFPAGGYLNSCLEAQPSVRPQVPTGYTAALAFDGPLGYGQNTAHQGAQFSPHFFKHEDPMEHHQMALAEQQYSVAPPPPLYGCHSSPDAVCAPTPAVHLKNPFASHSAPYNTDSTAGQFYYSTEYRFWPKTVKDPRRSAQGRSRVDKRPYMCNFVGCTKRYFKLSHLQMHLRKHTGERPYQCEHTDCGRRFSRSDQLKRHQRRHTGVKPFQCKTCQRKFARSDHLKTHTRTHTGKPSAYYFITFLFRQPPSFILTHLQHEINTELVQNSSNVPQIYTPVNTTSTF
uniref:WT1 transcription factor n=1 Tax=Eptatretus burgeri TaxID=7764 RepID=A0A8C4QZB7_EPTBU